MEAAGVDAARRLKWKMLRLQKRKEKQKHGTKYILV